MINKVAYHRTQIRYTGNLEVIDSSSHSLDRPPDCTVNIYPIILTTINVTSGNVMYSKFNPGSSRNNSTRKSKPKSARKYKISFSYTCAEDQESASISPRIIDLQRLDQITTRSDHRFVSEKLKPVLACVVQRLIRDYKDTKIPAILNGYENMDLSQDDSSNTESNSTGTYRAPLNSENKLNKNTSQSSFSSHLRCDPYLDKNPIEKVKSKAYSKSKSRNIIDEKDNLQSDYQTSLKYGIIHNNQFTSRNYSITKMVEPPKHTKDSFLFKRKKTASIFEFDIMTLFNSADVMTCNSSVLYYFDEFIYIKKQLLVFTATIHYSSDNESDHSSVSNLISFRRNIHLSEYCIVEGICVDKFYDCRRDLVWMCADLYLLENYKNQYFQGSNSSNDKNNDEPDEKLNPVVKISNNEESIFAAEETTMPVIKMLHSTETVSSFESELLRNIEHENRHSELGVCRLIEKMKRRLPPSKESYSTTGSNESLLDDLPDELCTICQGDPVICLGYEARKSVIEHYIVMLEEVEDVVIKRLPDNSIDMRNLKDLLNRFMEVNDVYPSIDVKRSILSRSSIGTLPPTEIDDLKSTDSNINVEMYESVLKNVIDFIVYNVVEPCFNEESQTIEPNQSEPDQILGIGIGYGEGQPANVCLIPIHNESDHNVNIYDILLDPNIKIGPEERFTKDYKEIDPKLNNDIFVDLPGHNTIVYRVDEVDQPFNNEKLISDLMKSDTDDNIYYKEPHHDPKLDSTIFVGQPSTKEHHEPKLKNSNIYEISNEIILDDILESEIFHLAKENMNGFKAVISDNNLDAIMSEDTKIIQNDSNIEVSQNPIVDVLDHLFDPDNQHMSTINKLLPVQILIDQTRDGINNLILDNFDMNSVGISKATLRKQSSEKMSFVNNVVATKRRSIISINSRVFKAHEVVIDRDSYLLHSVNKKSIIHKDSSNTQNFATVATSSDNFERVTQAIITNDIFVEIDDHSAIKPPSQIYVPDIVETTPPFVKESSSSTPPKISTFDDAILAESFSWESYTDSFDSQDTSEDVSSTYQNEITDFIDVFNEISVENEEKLLVSLRDHAHNHQNSDSKRKSRKKDVDSNVTLSSVRSLDKPKTVETHTQVHLMSEKVHSEGLPIFRTPNIQNKNVGTYTEGSMISKTNLIDNNKTVQTYSQVKTKNVGFGTIDDEVSGRSAIDRRIQTDLVDITHTKDESNKKTINDRKEIDDLLDKLRKILSKSEEYLQILTTISHNIPEQANQSKDFVNIPMEIISLMKNLCAKEETSQDIDGYRYKSLKHNLETICKSLNSLESKDRNRPTSLIHNNFAEKITSDSQTVMFDRIIRCVMSRLIESTTEPTKCHPTNFVDRSWIENNDPYNCPGTNKDIQEPQSNIDSLIAECCSPASSKKQVGFDNRSVYDEIACRMKNLLQDVKRSQQDVAIRHGNNPNPQSNIYEGDEPVLERPDESRLTRSLSATDVNGNEKCFDFGAIRHTVASIQNIKPSTNQVRKIRNGFRNIRKEVRDKANRLILNSKTRHSMLCSAAHGENVSNNVVKRKVAYKAINRKKEFS